jgi:outer membrane protein OmpA-like peptidoglycan-associated protein
MKKLLSICFIFFTVIGFSQSKKLWLELADDAYLKRDYANAANYYAKVLDDTTILRSYVIPYEAQLVNLKMKSLFKVPEIKSSRKKDSINVVKDDPSQNATKYDFIQYRLANSYRLNFDYKHAAEQYKKVVDRNAYPDAPYYYGLSLMALKRYQDALVVFDGYSGKKPSTDTTASKLTLPKNDSLVKIAARHAQSCYFALDTLSGKKNIKIRLMDSLVFNRGTSNFAPQYYLSSDKVIFTSARKGGVVSDPEKQDSRYFCDLYYTTLDDTIWQRPVNFGRPVNTSLHEGSGVFTPEEVMLFTRWSDNNRNEAFIYMARTLEGKFYEAMKLGTHINLPGYKSQQPFVTSDGKKLFFSSNRPGGKGGFDIWMAAIDENGFIGNPVNVGAPVNTSGDEVTPFFHTLGSTLYFSSNGFTGLGGLDVYKSALNPDDSVYAFPKNMNTPINSAKDDAYFILDKMQGKGFFASDRKDCPSGHCYNIYSYENEPIKFSLEGIVFDAQSGDPIPSALVTIRDVHGVDDDIYVPTDDKGFYSVDLKLNMQYFLKAQKTGYFGDANEVATEGKTESEVFQRDFNLNKIPSGDIEIEGIEYDFDKATLRPKSMEILDKIVDLLKLNDNISIELGAHTDARGNDDYNLKLSAARAKSCVDYIVSKGINKARIVSNGYGETRPIIPEAEINAMVPKSPEWEAAHQKNRRTAFKVTGESSLNIINKTK